MDIETVKEKININKLVAKKTETFVVEGDMIVPDSKPDVINIVNSYGIISIYKKEIQDGKIKLEGNVNTYMMYISDDENDIIRGLRADIDFVKNIKLDDVKEGMTCKVKTELKNIETKIINGRKVGIKITMEVCVKVYCNEEIEFIKDILNKNKIQLLQDNITINSLVSKGESKIFAKDTISTNPESNLKEILGVTISIGNKDVKNSYNKILTKADADVKILYLTDENKIESVSSKIPIVGFIDIPNVSDESISDVEYELKNIVVNPNETAEHSIYVEIEVFVNAYVYETKQIQLIQDLYDPVEKIEFNKREVVTITEKMWNQEKVNIDEKITINDLVTKAIVDTNVVPIIKDTNITTNKITYIGELEIKFILADTNMNIENKIAKIPFEYNLNIEGISNKTTELNIDVINSNFIIQENYVVSCKIDLQMNVDIYKNIKLNVINEINDVGKRTDEDYSFMMYIVKNDDTLWNIAKTYGSTVDAIIKMNEIEENKINIGQKIYIPH